MTRLQRTLSLAAVLLFALTTTLRSQPPAPTLFFSDLQSGPNSGGQNNNGLFVTVFGKDFGSRAADSYITVGNGKVVNYPVWTKYLWYDKLTFQLGPAAQSGDIVLHTVNGASNPLPFTVRPGNIYFARPNGSNSNPGTFEQPWLLPCHAGDVMQPGDTVYLDSVSQSADAGCKSSGWGGAVNLLTSGEPGRPIAFVGYPGSHAVIGNPDKNIHGFWIPNIAHGSTPFASYFVFAELDVFGGGPQNIVAIKAGARGGPDYTSKSAGYWIVGNDVSAPKAVGNFQGSTIFCSLADNVQVLGNYVHDTAMVSPKGTTKGDHSIYFTTDCNHAVVAWNEVDGTYHASTNSGNACRGIVFHSSPVNGGGTGDLTGQAQYDLHVHDNYIHDTHCDGIHFNTVDPSKGPVEAYNNLLVRAGTGVLNGERSNYACIFGNHDWSNLRPAPLWSGAVLIYNNTLNDCGLGGKGTADSGALNNAGLARNVFFNATNNTITVIPPEPLLGGNTTLIYGTGNTCNGGLCPF